MQSATIDQVKGVKRPYQSSTSEKKIIVEKPPKTMEEARVREHEIQIKRKAKEIQLAKIQEELELMEAQEKDAVRIREELEKSHGDSDEDEVELNDRRIESLNSQIRELNKKLEDCRQTLERRKVEYLEENKDQEGCKEMDELLQNLDMEVTVAEKTDREHTRQIFEKREHAIQLDEELEELKSSKIARLKEINFRVLGEDAYSKMFDSNESTKEVQYQYCSDSADSQLYSAKKQKRTIKHKRLTEKLKAEVKDLTKEIEEITAQNNAIFIRKEAIARKRDKLNNAKLGIEFAEELIEGTERTIRRYNLDIEKSKEALKLLNECSEKLFLLD